MSEQDEPPDQQPRGEAVPSAGSADVRDALELTRQALEASAAEIERSRRLLRETQELGALPATEPPDNAGDDREAS